jgi:putative colanic acid biosynthesis UDP-glucose lipid carrier transferase
MNEPVILKNSMTIACVALLQLVMPAIVAVVSLYSLIDLFDVDMDRPFHVLALVVAGLSLLLPRPPRTMSAQVSAEPWPLATGVIFRWMMLLGGLLAIGYITKFSGLYSRRVVLSWALLTPAVVIPVTLLLNEWMRRLVCDPSNARRVVFAGCNEASIALARQLRTNSKVGMSVLGFFDDRSRDRLNDDGVTGEAQLLGRLKDLPAFADAHGVNVIFLALPIRKVARVMELLDQLRDSTVSIYYVPDIAVFDLIQTRSATMEGVPVIAMCETPFHGYNGIAKRATDIILTSLIVLMVAPLMALVALLVRMSSPGPVIFKQQRYGLNGERFTVYKFRTMFVMEDGAEIRQASRNDPRTTPIGRFLRSYSLDELPQLINVLQGRMSLVGPRPHAVAHNEMYRKLIKGYMARHKVLPGITGLAQVSGFRGETADVAQMEARVRYDLEYLRNWSIGLDLRILAKTALRVMKDSRAF